jgi:hypothetical protein
MPAHLPLRELSDGVFRTPERLARGALPRGEDPRVPCAQHRASLGPANRAGTVHGQERDLKLDVARQALPCGSKGVH